MTDGKLNYNFLYLQVRDVLSKRIVHGLYPPGKSIPSDSKLASDFGTSISTIRQALSLLVEDGMNRVINAVSGETLGGYGERYDFPLVHPA